MPVIISMLRGVNVGGHNIIKMEALRELYESLKLRDARTYVQSGNVVFLTEEGNFPALAKRIGARIEKEFGVRSDVILRTSAEMKSVIARNPFAERREIEARQLLVTFLASEPAVEARENLLRLKFAPEELHVDGRELYVYYPKGIARAKLSFPVIERTLKISGTGRNWNSVTKLLEIAEAVGAD